MKDLYKRTSHYTLILFFLWLLVPSLSSAQTTGYSGTGGNINVIYQRCNWRINPDSAIKAIGGSVLMRFKTVQSNVSSISFDLNSALTISKIVFRGVNRPAASISRSGNVVTLALGVTLANNFEDEIDIFYNGTPPAFSTYGEGYEKGTIAGGNVIYTLAESYGDDDWWPCKADMQDKIDSIDFIISMPSAFRAATSGVLVSDVVSGASRIMTYQHRYPIASYLVSVGVAQYNVFDRGTVNINGTNVPVVYYACAGHGATPTTQLTAMDFCKQELVAFSNKYGDYPFKKEKYGMYEFGWGGGMEHQTFSSMGWSTMSNWSVIAHELAHQWFGDKVTFGTWNHLWLAEGFAKYSEVLAAELVAGLGQNPITHRSGIKSTAMSTSTEPIYLSSADIANSNTLWTSSNDNAIYQRGAMVVSMLRKLAGDTKFFQALQNYMADPALAYRSATTDDLKNHFEAVLHRDLDPFFTDYIYGMGNPAYDVRWGTGGNWINIELTTQRRSHVSAVAYFRTPVVIRVSNGLSGGAKRDTTVVIYDQNGQVSFAGNGISVPKPGKILSYKLSFTPAVVTMDPDAETLVRGQDGVTATTNRVAQSTVTQHASLNTSPLITLPVDITEFSGIPTSRGNLLSLDLIATSAAIKVTLERSDNGADFYTLGEMSKALASQGVKFNFEDNRIGNLPAYYYRAKVIDEQGVISYSKVVRIINEEENKSIRLSPNPASKQVTIQWTSLTGSGSVTQVKLISLGGQIMWTKSTSGASITVETESIPTGSYFVQIATNNQIFHKKLIIQR